MSIKISIPKTELYDEENNQFIYIKEQNILLEHSLVSLQKWEQKWKIPFLDQSRDKTVEMVQDYIRCMTLTQNVDNNAYKAIPLSEWKRINEYISDPMTATTIRNIGKGKKEIITAEIIYYWMIKFGIPPEYRKWHLNSLLMLIEVCGVKESPEQQRSASEIAAYHRQINAANRAKYHSKG